MQKITFENLPSTNTPINATNLNAMQTNTENAISGVVEYGSGTNGEYVKFDNGTMICWQKRTYQNIQITNASGVLYKSGDLEMKDYPVAFVGNLPSVSRSIESSTWDIYGFGCTSSSNQSKQASLTNSGSFFVFRGGSTGTGNVTVVITQTAIGRWK